MTCMYCGKVIDEETGVCPYCGSDLTSPAREDQQFYSHEEAFEDPVMAAEKTHGKSATKFSMPKFNAPKFSAPKLEGINLQTVLAGAAVILCLISLIMIGSVNRQLTAQAELLSGQVGALSYQINAVEDRLGQIDSTVAGVQSEAYNQLASQAIVITKDVTPLTGPVTAGKYNVMFIVSAKGNLDLDNSFDWQKFNESTQGWTSIVFTGDATSNEEYGLRLENTYDKTTNDYTTKLWANGITPAAAGTYRCVITDITGIAKTSAEAIVSVDEG